MKKGSLKRLAAVTMAAVMLCSMTGCGGGKKDGGAGGKSSDDKKYMTYEGTAMTLSGYEGDFSTLYVQNDKLYFETYEWVDESGKTAEDEDSEDGVTDDGSAGDAAEESTGEDSADDASEESTGEDSAEDATEEETGEGSAEDVTEEETGEDSTEDEAEEDAGNEDDDTSDEEYVEDMEGYSVNRLYSANLDGSDVKEIPCPELGESEWRQSFYFAKDGTIAYLVSSYDSDSQKSTYSIVKIDEQGNELLKQNITSALKLTEESYISKMVMDDKGRFVIVSESVVYLLDDKGSSIGEIKAEGYMDGAAVTKDGKIICGTMGQENAEVKVVDVDGKKWGETIKLDIRYFSGSDSLMNGVDYDFYYKDESGIYGYDIASKKSTQIMDYVASNLTSDNTWGILPAGDGKFIGTDWSDGESKLVVYNKVDPSTITDKTTITYASLWSDDTVKRAAIEFNKKSKEYRIEMKDYSSEEDSISKMNADILAGNIPDIIGLGNLPVDQYAAKGLLEDLTPYFEKDSDISEDDILDSVLQAMKIEDKLYFITPSFDMSTLVARKSDVGEAAGWTFDDMKELLEKKGDGVRPFYSENKSDMLYSFLGNGITDFVDWQTGECSFDGQDFKDILEICNSYGVDEETEWSEDSPSMPTLIREGKVLFVEGYISAEEVQMYKKMFEGDIAYIGYPNEEKSGSFFQFSNCQLGISAKSKVKDGAWEFLKSFMTKEYQGTQYNLYSTPVRKDCFEMYMKTKTATEAYTDELGQEIEPLRSSWGWDDLEVEITPLSDDEAQMYIDLVNHTTKVGNYNDSMMEIVIEEAKHYFAGEKGLDETADIIQNRIKTYVNENR